MSGLTSMSPPNIGLPSTPLTATAFTSAFLDVITSTSVDRPLEQVEYYASGRRYDRAAQSRRITSSLQRKRCISEEELAMEIRKTVTLVEEINSEYGARANPP